MADGTFLVLLEDPTGLALRVGALARVVAKTTRVPAADAAQRVRYGGGIVARDLDEATAEKLRAALAADGHGAFVLKSSWFEAPPRARRTTALVPSADG